MTAVLVVTQGPLAGRRIELNGELVVGREDVSLSLEDPELSRRHAAIRPVAGGVEIEDLGSTNGTFVNSRRIEAPTRIAGGDTIKIGSSVLVIEGARAADTVMSATPVAAASQTTTPAAGIAPDEPFGTYAAPAAAGRRRGIASRQLMPLLLSWAAVVGTAVGLALYFAMR